MHELEYIKGRLPTTEILCQLAEEAAELSQAALKLRRVLDGTNPTPVTEAAAWEGFFEEYGDVLICVSALELTQTDLDGILQRRKPKIERWANRLRAVEP